MNEMVVEQQRRYSDRQSCVREQKQGPPCPACSSIMHQSSGQKWMCRGCGYLVSCCD